MIDYIYVIGLVNVFGYDFDFVCVGCDDVWVVGFK